ncbi:MAG: hypothetical protein AUJ56_10065 [Zetaproteobacteria bacterium CG1_02_49_23]|nr:MAG: hypothetical protein AUJ56_10065 [Zetaproteobacteria bacterium CG1_02_49_23]
MKQNELRILLNDLIATWENAVEFKQAGNGYDTDRIGRYFSAMSNEANLQALDRVWLVFGVDNKSRAVIGSAYRSDPERLQSTKLQIADNTEPGITFRNIFELHRVDGRVVLFEVPATPHGMPIVWKGLTNTSALLCLIYRSCIKKYEIFSCAYCRKINCWLSRFPSRISESFWKPCTSVLAE